MIILIGASGAGKTTLIQALYGKDLEYRKTQSIEVYEDIIDTPGEFLERKQLSHGLTVTAYDADLVVLVDAADSEQFFFPPGYSAMFAVSVIGVVTKCDLANDTENAVFRLQYAGADKIFKVSAFERTGLAQFLAYLQQEGVLDSAMKDA